MPGGLQTQDRRRRGLGLWQNQQVMDAADDERNSPDEMRMWFDGAGPDLEVFVM